MLVIFRTEVRPMGITSISYRIGTIFWTLKSYNSVKKATIRILSFGGHLEYHIYFTLMLDP